MITDKPIVYIAALKEQPGVYKIGYTVNWTNRVHGLTADFGRIKLVHTITSDNPPRLESMLHVRFFSHNVRSVGTNDVGKSRELFKLHREHLTAIKLISSVRFLRPRSLGADIRTWRASRDLSHRGVARLLRVPEYVVRDVENSGYFWLDPYIIVRVARLIGVSPLALV